MKPVDAHGYHAEEPVDLRPVSVPRPAAGPPGPKPAAQREPSDLLVEPAPVSADPATWGWRSLVRRGTAGMVSPRPSITEVRHRLAQAAVQKPFAGPRLVMVANPKGGARKTTTALVLGYVFGMLRGGSVAVWDNNETRGTLGYRAEVVRPQTTVSHLLRVWERLIGAGGTAGDLAYYLRSQPARCDVLASDDDPAHLAQISHVECGRIDAVLSRHYRITIMDTGDNVRTMNWQWAAHAADQLVIPITTDADVAHGAAWMCEHLASRGLSRLVATAVTVASPGQVPAERAEHERILEYFAERTALVVEVPHDPHLAGGHRVVASRLSQASRRAWIAAAAAIADQLSAVQNRRPDQEPTLDVADGSADTGSLTSLRQQEQHASSSTEAEWQGQI